MDFLSGSKPTKNVVQLHGKKCAIHHVFFFVSQELVTEGLESTLIRNLTDHLGNNLLHCVCSAGHTPLLPLLTSRFGNELTGALSDENRKGLTPVQIAIKVSKCDHLFFYASKQDIQNLYLIQVDLVFPIHCVKKKNFFNTWCIFLIYLSHKNIIRFG